MFAPFTYSPISAENYQISNIPTCIVKEIQKLPQATAVWNFYWLSYPEIDTLPGAGDDWGKHYTPPSLALVKAILDDVTLDEVLFRRVSSQPHKFAAWWCRQDYSIYDTYSVLGDKWAVTVLERAHQAIDRMRLAKVKS